MVPLTMQSGVVFVGLLASSDGAARCASICSKLPTVPARDAALAVLQHCTGRSASGSGVTPEDIADEKQQFEACKTILSPAAGEEALSPPLQQAVLLALQIFNSQKGAPSGTFTSPFISSPSLLL